VIFNDCLIHVLELSDDGPYVTKTCSIRKIYFCCSTVLANYLYICNTQQDAHYKDVHPKIARDQH
jgi:hypothetical protein